MARAGELGADQALAFLREIDSINMRRRVRMVDLARESLGGSIVGRRIAVLGELLDERSATGSTPRSTLERSMDGLLVHTALPTPSPEYPIPSVEPGAGFADRAWEEALLILEIDGRTYHRRVAQLHGNSGHPSNL